VSDDVVVDLREDWQFHQATGMVAVQIGSPDMEKGARRIVAIAAERGESAHDVAVSVIEGRLRISEAGAAEAAASAAGPDDELRTVQAELHRLLHQSESWSFEGDEAARYTKLARLEVYLHGQPDERLARR
jgi:hypothetical protein